MFYFSKHEGKTRSLRTDVVVLVVVVCVYTLNVKSFDLPIAQTSPTGEATVEAAAEPAATPEVVEQERGDVEDDPEETGSRRQSLKDDVDGQVDALTSNSRHSTEASVKDESTEQQQQQSTEDADDVSSSQCRYPGVRLVRKGQGQR